MTFTLSTTDIDEISKRYDQRYSQFGYSPRTLDWDKGKQELRFSILTSNFDLRGKSILDIGCGFGDLNRILAKSTDGDYDYLGVDISATLLSEARSRYGSERVRFACGDFLAHPPPVVDYAIASGIFNLLLREGDNYEFIQQVMERAFAASRIGFAFDFLSDKVDFKKDNTFHSSPERILQLAYRLSRNVMLINNYMPFEFSLIVLKDDSFDPGCTIFNRWISLNSGPTS